MRYRPEARTAANDYAERIRQLGVPKGDAARFVATALDGLPG